MCKPIPSQVACSTMETLIHQLGDESQMDFLLTNFCENIIEDADLRKQFEHLSLDQMLAILNSLIKAAFENNLIDGKVRNHIVMKNYTLFELGINVRGFEKLRVHFESALRKCWIEEGLIQEFTEQFGELESIFAGEGAELRKSAEAHMALACKFATAQASVI